MLQDNILNTEKMSKYQWLIVGICTFLYIIDGFDFMVMAFAASAVAKELTLTGTQIGTLISAGLVGMTVGSLMVAPLADRIGRRKLTLISLILCTVSMLGASMAGSLVELGIYRFITGIGIGGVQISCMVLATEYSNKKLKGLSVGLLSSGYGLGAVIGGVLSVYLIGDYGWRSVFLFGGIATLIGLIISLFYLPESLEYLVKIQPKDALNKLNKIMQKIGNQTIEFLPKNEVATQADNAIKKIFSPQYVLQTFILWVAMFFILFGFYFVMGWTPKLIASAGLSSESGMTMGMMISVGGMIGSLIFGLFSTKFRTYYVQAFFLFSTASAIILFVNSTHSLTLLITAAIILGLFINGCLAGIYTISTSIYETKIRSTGVGFATGIGRFGGISSPIIAGHFLDQGTAPLTLYGYFSIIFVCAAICILLLSYFNQKQEINQNLELENY